MKVDDIFDIKYLQAIVIILIYTPIIINWVKRARLVCIVVSSVKSESPSSSQDEVPFVAHYLSVSAWGKMADFGDRVNMMFAHGSFLKHDIPVSGTTDNPAGLLNPLLGIQTMVTRRSNEGEVLGPEQRISAEEALKVYTLGSAYSCFEEDQKGSIAPSVS